MGIVLQGQADMKVKKHGPNPDSKHGALGLEPHALLARTHPSPTEPQCFAPVDLGQHWWSVGEQCWTQWCSCTEAGFI